MSKINLSESLSKLKDILTSSDNSISDFRNNNRNFHAQLIEKIKIILTKIQSLASNPNIKNLTEDLAKSQGELASMQQQLQESNAQLVTLQQEMTKIQQEKAELERKMQSSGDDNGKLQQQMQDLQQQLNDCLASQNDYIDNIAQVNNLLTKQVDNINGMLLESTDYNSDYDAQISAIASNLEAVVNLLNGSNQRGPGQGSKKNPPTTGNVSDVFNDYANMSKGGKRRRRTHKKNAKKYTRKMKGGYNWSAASSSSNTKSSLKKRKGHSRHK
jgi:chromosome segregation ATPase